MFRIFFFEKDHFTLISKGLIRIRIFYLGSETCARHLITGSMGVYREGKMGFLHGVTKNFLPPFQRPQARYYPRLPFNALVIYDQACVYSVNIFGRKISCV